MNIKFQTSQYMLQVKQKVEEIKMWVRNKKVRQKWHHVSQQLKIY